MRHAYLRNAASNETIASVVRAHGMFERTFGLLGSPSVPVRSGMWFERCAAVHTLGMRSAIDVIFLDADERVLRTVAEVAPNRLAVLCPKARITIELGPGTLERARVNVGDRLYLLEIASVR